MIEAAQDVLLPELFLGLAALLTISRGRISDGIYSRSYRND